MGGRLLEPYTGPERRRSSYTERASWRASHLSIRTIFDKLVFPVLVVLTTAVIFGAIKAHEELALVKKQSQDSAETLKQIGKEIQSFAVAIAVLEARVSNTHPDQNYEVPLPLPVAAAIAKAADTEVKKEEEKP